jgi:hypothetical protein
MPKCQQLIETHMSLLSTFSGYLGSQPMGKLILNVPMWLGIFGSNLCFRHMKVAFAENRCEWFHGEIWQFLS